jgi:hypothetical protein
MAVIFLTTPGAGTWTVPNDCALAKFECIGSGAGGFSANASAYGGGGGAGAYAAANAVSLTPGATVYLSIGTGGAANTSGADTWINKAANSAPAVSTNGALAKGGNAATTVGTVGGLGGAAASCVGNATASGGAGGSSVALFATAGGGGGGAGGPSGDGKAGGLCPGNVASYAGGGGGGANGGASTAGTASAAGGTTGGAGGAGTSGSGSGSSGGGNGTVGGGGGGGNGSAGSGAATSGGAGGSDTAFDAAHGCGGGGGGGGCNNLGVGAAGGGGGGYGGGGGGGGYGAAGAAGSQGLIVITYTSTNIGSFLPFEHASKPAAAIARDFSGFVYSPPPAALPITQRFFSQWETPAGTNTRSIADFSGFSLPPRILRTGAYPLWDEPAKKCGSAADFQGFVALPAPVFMGRFDLWEAAPRPIARTQISTFCGFIPLFIIKPLDIDAVYRPRKKDLAKSKPRPRPDYSIYNQPHPVPPHQEQDDLEEDFAEEAPEDEEPIAAIVIADAAPTAEETPQVGNGQLLPMEHFGLLSQSWTHAIHAPEQAPAPQPQDEPDQGADDIFASIIQMAMTERQTGGSPPEAQWGEFVNNALRSNSGEDYNDIIRELKSILHREK